MQIEHHDREGTLWETPRLTEVPSLPEIKPMGWSSPIALHLSERKVFLGVVDLLIFNSMLVIRLILTKRLEPELSSVVEHWHWFVIFSLIWLPIATAVGCYDLQVAAKPFSSVFRTVQAFLLAFGVYLIIPHISAPLVEARIAWFIQVLFSLVLVGLWRLGYTHLVAQPIFRRRVLIVGAGVSGRTVANTVRLHAESDYEIVGFVDDDPGKGGSEIEGVPVLGGAAQLPRLAQQLQATDIVLAITHEVSPTLFGALLHCQELGHTISTMPLLYELLTGRVPVQHLSRDWWSSWSDHSPAFLNVYLVFKRLMDVVIAGPMLLLMVILLPGLAVAIKLDSPGPIFYKQMRVGRNGRPFYVYKLRTMITQAEADGRARWATHGDPRITRVGRWLRKTRLDEVPQLFNIFRGEMTLIGPRPERPDFVDMLSTTIPFYRARHVVKPGLTGWAQVSYKYGSSVEDSLVKLEYDLFYIKHQGPYLDLLTLLKTVGVVLRLEGV